MRPLFVYGTLMEQGAQSGLLGSCVRRPATMRGSLFSMPAGYPALRPDDAGVVHGELVDLDSEGLLAILDTYEGVHQGLYRRVVLPARVGIKPVPAWVYVMSEPEAKGGRPLSSGRWRSIRRRWD